MAKLVRRDRPLTDLIDWVETEMSMAPPLHRPLLSSSPLRVEEQVDDKHYTLRVEIPGIDPERDGILQVTVPLNKAEKPETTKVAITKG